MKTRIYLGEDVVVATKQINRYKIEFSANPSNSTRIAFDIKKNGVIVENVDKTFNGTTSNLSLTITGLTPTITAENLLGNLEIYNTNSITTYQLATEVNSYGNLDIYIDVVGDIADVFTFTSLSNTTGGKVTLINVGQISTYDINEIAYSLLDLFEDENIEVTSKLSDIEKLSNVFLDFSNSFSVPATAKNNEILRHYYDVDIDNTFNANIRINGYIEIDSFPFRFGRIQLEGITLKNKKPDSYKITFYGGVVQLSDLFGDDTINLLDYDTVLTGNTETLVKVRNLLGQFDFEYNASNFIDSFDSPNFKNGDVITPLIAYTNRDWNYGSNDSLDIATTAGAIIDSETFQALRVIRIIEAIEGKYGLTFSREFFGSAVFNNLFMWLNGNVEPLAIETSVGLINGLTDRGTWSGPDVLIDDFIQLDTTNDYIILNVPRVGTTVRDFADCEFWVRPYVINLSNIGTKFKVIARNYDTGEIIAESAIRTGNDSIGGSPSLFLKFKQRATDYTVRIKLSIELSNTATFDLYTIINMFITPSVSGPAYADRIRQTQPNTQTITANRTMSDTLPKMKVIEFLQGIMKQFKLIIRPISGSQFYVNTLNGYYSDGNILNVSEFIDNEEIKVERPEIYKTINFNYQKTNNVLGKRFRETNDPINDLIGYGDLSSVYAAIDSKNELKVQLPFENMLFERISVLQPSAQAGEITDWLIGQSISTSDNTTFSKNNSRPILFFSNGIVSNVNYPIKIKFGDSLATNIIYTHLIGNTNDELLDQVTDTINWGAEVDPWHNQVVANSLYLNYWSDWINTIYDLRQRKFTYEGYLPPRYIEELSLNDRLLIGNQRFKINDYKINLLDGKTQLTLFNDIFDWNAYSFPSSIVYNERSFSPNGWYMTDTIDNGDSAYIYGSFTGYNSTAYGRIVKLLPNGDVDTSFNTGTGFNNNSFGFQSIVKQTDGKLVVTGNFTSFNGTARNRIARLNTDGSLDTSLVVGTGFNNITSGVEVDSQGRIVVCGSYASYSGVSANRIIRLLSGGTVDTSFVYGTAFNNVTNSVVINSDDSMYVGGYFSTYSGITSNRIIKLTSGGTVDTSFNVGTGLNSNTSNQPVGLISDGDGGVYVFGYFTTYSGITANRLTKLLPTGQIDPNFNIGNGFNGPVITAYKVLNDKLLISGTFTSFNGLTVSNGTIVLNSDGSIYRTFSGNYNNIFTIGNRFYGNLNNGVTELIDDESLPTISPTTIIANAGVKYYGINILKNFNWSVTKIDLGYGTDWIDITTPSGTRATEVVIRIEEKATQSAPQVYQPRYMILRFNFDGIYREVTIVQNGLEQ
jgi:hypothetical protein